MDAISVTGGPPARAAGRPPGRSIEERGVVVAQGGLMYVTLVHIHVKPDQVDTFLDATRANHEASTREPGNLRFDVLRSVDEPLRFLLYESYVDEASAKAHKDTPHYAAWRDATADVFAEPRHGVRYEGLYPETAAG
jgi:autoinducer 2-degrading protein